MLKAYLSMEWLGSIYLILPGTGFRMPAATSQGQSVEDPSGTDTEIITITRIAAVSGRGRDATVELLCPYVARKAGIPR